MREPKPFPRLTENSLYSFSCPECMTIHGLTYNVAKFAACQGKHIYCPNGHERTIPQHKNVEELNKYLYPPTCWDIQTCPTCALKFGIDKDLNEIRRKDGKDFFCPNGHSIFYSEARKKKGGFDQYVKAQAELVDQVKVTLKLAFSVANKKKYSCAEDVPEEVTQNLLKELMGILGKAEVLSAESKKWIKKE